MAASIAVASPAMAQSETATPAPLRVGIIDSPVERILGGHRDVSVQKQSFLAPGQVEGVPYTAIHQTHGTVVATSFVEQARRVDRDRPIEIYSAQAFVSRGETTTMEGQKVRHIGLDYAAARRSLDWFKEKGVRVVVAAFITADRPDMQAFMARARELNMVVFASANNGPVRFNPFPAMHPDAIAVTGSDSNLDFRFNRSMDGWVRFKAEGALPGGSGRDQVENGSSFATARAAAYGAFMAAERSDVTRDEVVQIMAAGSENGDVVDVTRNRYADRFPDRVREMLPSILAARGGSVEPEAAPVTVATARATPAARQAAMMSAAGLGR